MNHCDGIMDWLECLRCELICTKMCPLEGDNVVEALALQLRQAGKQQEITTTDR